MVTLHGRVPGWALLGYGSGDGSGYGYGSGSGYGSGYGDDLERAVPPGGSLVVRAAHLKANGACADEYRRFQKVFPEGARYPEDITKALENSFDLGWAREKLGLLPLLTEDVAA